MYAKNQTVWNVFGAGSVRRNARTGQFGKQKHSLELRHTARDKSAYECRMFIVDNNAEYRNAFCRILSHMDCTSKSL